MTPAFGVRTAAAVRARHGQDAAALQDGARNEVAAAAAALTHALVAWPLFLGRHRSRQKLAPAAAGEMPHHCVVASLELHSTEERVGQSPFARCSGERSYRVAMSGVSRAAVTSCASASRRRRRSRSLSRERVIREEWGLGLGFDQAVFRSTPERSEPSARSNGRA